MKASTEIQYFEGPIGFKIPDENMISKAVGILNTEKVEPFYAIDPNLAESFVTNKKGRGRIQNEDDWGEEVEGLKHLIRAFYQAAPKLWRKWSIPIGLLRI
ncbi:hypothetical protein M1M86_00940 [Dehalococcoidales bacterium]|nr:hypothetical protein [Dehalococcoidales bacterium]